MYTSNFFFSSELGKIDNTQEKKYQIFMFSNFQFLQAPNKELNKLKISRIFLFTKLAQMKSLVLISLFVIKFLLHEIFH
jgi:hypothetical protein